MPTQETIDFVSGHMQMFKLNRKAFTFVKVGDDKYEYMTMQEAEERKPRSVVLHRNHECSEWWCDRPYFDLCFKEMGQLFRI